MADAPNTRATLLLRIRDPQDDKAWTQFVDVYGPLVFRYARKHGMQDADASDLTQETLLAVARFAGNLQYDPARGHFRAWLLTVARNKLRNAIAKYDRQPKGSGDSSVRAMLNEQPEGEADTAAWDQEYQKRLFECAAEMIRSDFQESTWQAFWQSTVEAKEPKDVAAALQLSLGAVYIAKSRVLARLKEQIALLEES